MAKKPTATKAKATKALWSGTADKTHAVSAAVASQLHKEGRWPPNDLSKVMSTDYRYDQFTVGNFLEAVQWNLAHGTPSCKFTYGGSFIKKALTATVGALMVA